MSVSQGTHSASSSEADLDDDSECDDSPSPRDDTFFRVVKQACLRSTLDEVRPLVEQLRATSSHIEADLESLVFDAYLNTPNVLEYLLSTGATFNPVCPLFVVKHGHRSSVETCIERLELFLRYGWDINHDDVTHGTALNAAICRCCVPLAEYLISRGADVNMETTKGSGSFHNNHQPQGCPMGTTPLDIAAACSSLPMIQLLLDHGAILQRSNPLHALAVADGERRDDCFEIIEFFLDKGMDINGIESFPEDTTVVTTARGLGTPLHYAAALGTISIVRYLLDHGANVHAEGTNGSGTPLFWAENATTAVVGQNIIVLLKEKEANARIHPPTLVVNTLFVAM